MPLRLSRRRVIVCVLAALLLITAALASYRLSMNARTDAMKTMTLGAKGLQQLKQRAGSSADVSRIGEGVLPPTNSWISGAVLQKKPLPTFPMPLSLGLQDTGYSVGVPTVSVSEKTIAAPHVAAITANVADATHMKLTRFDKVSATLGYFNQQDKAIGQLTVAQGSPYTFYRSKTQHDVRLSGIDELRTVTAKKAQVTIAGTTYVAIIEGKGTFATGENRVTARLGPNDLLTILGAPTVDADTLAAEAMNDIISTTASYQQNGRSVTTTISYKTSTGGPTYVGRVADTTKPDSPVFDTLYGQLPLEKTNTLSFSVPSVASSQALPLKNINDEQRSVLRTQLVKDVAATKIDKDDTYFGGKQLARAANLLTIASQLKDESSAQKLIVILNDAFSKRLGAKYFYYDSQLKGVAPYEAAFGAEDFNDHHFHYGYYLYAASILAANDQAFLAKHRDQLDVLAADIATPKKTASLPEYRHYDPYAGHSWAAGLAPFADGNNQESSSEAMHAWNAVSLWGKVTANKSLQQTGEILLANEAYTARTLWRDVTVSGYDQPLVVLNWGGKRDYATFFSDRPSVMLGIQLIPLDPSMVASLRDDKSLVNRLVSASITGQDFNVPLGDYGMMYLAFSDAERAYQLALTQQDDSIDDGNSRTYLYAWIMNLR